MVAKKINTLGSYLHTSVSYPICSVCGLPFENVFISWTVAGRLPEELGIYSKTKLYCISMFLKKKH